MSADQLTILPPDHSLTGHVAPPGSKSITNRALLLAGLATSTSRLTAALQRAGFAPFLSALDHGRGGVYFYLLEVPGVVADSDPRLAAVAEALALEAGRVLTIGAYASPPTLAR